MGNEFSPGVLGGDISTLQFHWCGALTVGKSRGVSSEDLENS